MKNFFKATWSQTVTTKPEDKRRLKDITPDKCFDKRREIEKERLHDQFRVWASKLVILILVLTSYVSKGQSYTTAEDYTPINQKFHWLPGRFDSVYVAKVVRIRPHKVWDRKYPFQVWARWYNKKYTATFWTDPGYKIGDTILINNCWKRY